MSGRLKGWFARRVSQRGPAPSGASWLSPFVKLYELGVIARTVAYETDYLKVRRLARPVISVGNITLGGTGKTPIVAMLASFLRDEHYGVAILTRGYGRKGKGRAVLRSVDGRLGPEAYDLGGDEPTLLARELPGVAVVVDPDRFAAGTWAEREIGPDVFILDDGYQHLRLGRDLNLLVVDATDPFGGNRLPPLGRLREPLQGMRRADAVIVTRADREFDDAMIRRVVRGVCRPEVPIFYAYHDITELRPLDGGPPRSAYSFRNSRAGVLTAIGNPGVLLGDLERAGIRIVVEALFPDHHDYTQRDVDAAVGSARASGADAILTTEKDAIKLERLDTSALPVFAVRIEFKSEQEAMLKSMCLKAILGKA